MTFTARTVVMVNARGSQFTGKRDASETVTSPRNTEDTVF